MSIHQNRKATRIWNGEKTHCVHGGKTHFQLSNGARTLESGARSRGNGGSDKSGRSCGNDVSESEQPWVSFPLNPWNLSVICYHYEKETDIDASCYAVH